MVKHEDRLDTLHPALARLIRKVGEGISLTVLCTHRGKEEQDKAVSEGRSQLPWPKSLHNLLPARAVDVAPMPLDWVDTRRFDLFAGYVLGVAAELGIGIRWGGDWNRNWQPADDRLQDLVHFELLDDEGREP